MDGKDNGVFFQRPGESAFTFIHQYLLLRYMHPDAQHLANRTGDFLCMTKGETNKIDMTFFSVVIYLACKLTNKPQRAHHALFLQ